MRTAIITDSESGITQAEARQWGVWVVPMPIIIDNEIHYEGVGLSAEEMFRYMKAGRSVSSSQPAPDDLLKLWDEVLGEGYDELLYIPMTSGLSGSCQTAAALAAGYGGRVQVADNHQISVPQKNAVRDALGLIRAGYTAAQARERLEEAGGDTLIYIGVDTLEYLKKGGRITPAAAAMGAVLGIKPLLAIRGEKLDAFAKVRGTKQCRARLMEAMVKSFSEYRARAWTSASTPPGALRQRRSRPSGAPSPPRPSRGRTSTSTPWPSPSHCTPGRGRSPWGSAGRFCREGFLQMNVGLRPNPPGLCPGPARGVASGLHQGLSPWTRKKGDTHCVSPFLFIPTGLPWPPPGGSSPSGRTCCIR